MFVQAVLKFYDSDAGKLGGGQTVGVDGTLTLDGKVQVLQVFWDLIGRGYEFVDMGASSGVMLLMARAMGANLAVGIEVRSTGLDHVFKQARDIAAGRSCMKRCMLLEEECRIDPFSVHIAFGKAVGVTSRTGEWSLVSSLPTLQGEEDTPVGASGRLRIL